MRSPAPTPGAENPAAGRHRRPESLADTVREQPITPRQLRPRVSFTDVTAGREDTTRSARHRAGEQGSYSTTRTAVRADGNRGRHSRNIPAPRRSANSRPVTGAHRAPGTVPFEAWLNAAKNRPQILLGTLVAAGLLLTAVPIPQDGGANTSVMNAAAQAVASRISSTSEQPEQKREKQTEKPPPAAALPAVTETPEPPAPETTRPVESDYGDSAQQVSVPKGDGPFNSLRTTGSKVVALTFDDGPDPEQTPKILALLEQYQVKAVFCLVGTQAQAHPDLVRQIVAAGHALCNHTWSHDLVVGKKKANRIKADLDRTNAAIRAAVPGADIPYFRAPGGNFTDRLVKVAYADEMTSLYWEVDPRDWEHAENQTDEQHVKRIIADVKSQTRPGAIVLSHDFNQPTTIQAYEKLLPWLVENFQIGLPGDKAAGTPSPSTPSPGPSTTPTTPSPAPSTAPADESAGAAGASGVAPSATA